jgi:exonuclease III
VTPPPRRNGVLIAARTPFRERGPLTDRVEEPYRMLTITFCAPTSAGAHSIPLRVTGAHLPNLLRKAPYWDDLVRRACRCRSQHTVLLGDFNTTRHYNDEPGSVCTTSEYMDRIEAAGLRDVWRQHHPETRKFSWYSTHGNRCRIDHAFCTRAVAERVRAVRYSHTERTTGLSDHSLLVLDID